MRRLTWLSLATLLLAPPLAAQRPTTAIPLARLIATFLADSGVRTTGLDWTTGDSLPIRWESRTPVAVTEQWLAAEGFTRLRSGTLQVTAGDSVPLTALVTVLGSATGIARVSIGFASLQVDLAGGGGFFLTREMIDTALRNDGLQLQPLKCKRETEGASYGNLIDAVKWPGKTASGLWWFWQSVQQELEISLTIIYRKAEMNAVECTTN